MFALLYGGSLCVIGGLALVAVAVMARVGRRKHQAALDSLASVHEQAIGHYRHRYKQTVARCRELERELTEIKLGTAMAGYTFDQVPARTIPARTRMVKAR